MCIHEVECRLMFLSYMFIPLSVGMFLHLFQHWLTAKSESIRLL